VDKNLLDIGNATLKMKDSEGNTRIVKTKVRNHGHTPTLQLGTLGEEVKFERDFKDVFEKRKMSQN